jgi:hypothetical protein
MELEVNVNRLTGGGGFLGWFLDWLVLDWRVLD